MIKLKDYLGTLITSINQARVMADFESAKIAKAYASDDLLKHFSIPRFKAEDIVLDIPVAIDSFNEEQYVNNEPIDNKVFNSNAYSCMKDIAKVSSFSRNTSMYINPKIAEFSRNLEQDIKANIPNEEAFKCYQEKMSELFIETIEKEKIDIEKNNVLDFQKTLKEKLYPQIKPKIAVKNIEDANVIVEANKLRDIPDQNIVRIKMKLFEDSMQWHTSENTNGEAESYLLPD